MADLPSARPAPAGGHGHRYAESGRESLTCINARGAADGIGGAMGGHDDANAVRARDRLTGDRIGSCRGTGRGALMYGSQVPFADRSQAGWMLAERLRPLAGEDPVVLALARGGVPVGVEIARALDAPLDVVLVRRIETPCRPGVKLGAVVDDGRPETVIDGDTVRRLGIPEHRLAEESARRLEEIERRRARYLAGRARVPVAGRTAIVVDDGIATGATMAAALRAIRRAGPRRLVLAVPVASPGAIERLRPEVDDVVCLAVEDGLAAIGSFYRDFHHVHDGEVVELLRQAPGRVAAAARW
jgi:putative phosphoribosyl transferase